MRNWAILGLVAAASLGIAGNSLADVPSSLTSTVGCACTADPGGGASSQLPNKCTLTPSGTNPSEDINVSVVVRNVLGAPLAGSTVVVSSVGVNGAVFIFDDGTIPFQADEDPQTGLSNGSGVFSGTWDEGGVQMAGATTFPNLDFSTTASGPGPGGPVALAACAPQLSVISYDLNGNGVVDLVDFAIFAGDLASNDDEANFNWNLGGGDDVDLVDFALFAAELNTSIHFQ